MKYLDDWNKEINGRLARFSMFEEAGYYPALVLVLPKAFHHVFDTRPTRDEVEKHFLERKDFNSFCGQLG